MNVPQEMWGFLSRLPTVCVDLRANIAVQPHAPLKEDSELVCPPAKEYPNLTAKPEAGAVEYPVVSVVLMGSRC